MSSPSSDEIKRLGRAIIFVHQHDRRVTDPLVRARIEVLLLTGRAMDLAARLKGHMEFVPLTGSMVKTYASFAGVGSLELRSTVLPYLKRAEMIDYSVDAAGEICNLQEFVGISAPVVEQTVKLLKLFEPSRDETCFLHSVEIGALAPLARSQHLSQLVGRGFTDREAELALNLAKLIGINQEVNSIELNEDVVFSPYVWGSKQVSLANFLEKLPVNERDALLGMSQQVLGTPGLAISRLQATPELIRSATNAGLIQSATVHSATGGRSTYAFSPLLEAEDDRVSTTESFHLRKLFVAHILFGHERAAAGWGRIIDPGVLVQSLLSKGWVGPATNIGNDYHLLEAAGVVAVETTSRGPLLKLVKPEIAEAGLSWIRRITDQVGTSSIKLNQAPAGFSTPEESRSELGQAGEANELVVASVLELRKEMQRATRRDDPWS